MYAEAEAAALHATNRSAEQSDAHNRAAALRPRLARVTIQVSNAVAALDGLEVLRDNLPVGRAQWGVPLASDRGSHNIVAIAKGKQRWEATVQLDADGATQLVRIDNLQDFSVALPRNAPVEAPIRIDIDFHIGPVLRLSDAPPSTERVGLVVGADAFIALAPGLAAGLIYDHHELGSEQIVAQAKDNTPLDQANSLKVSRYMETLLGGVRVHALDSPPIRLAILVAAGPSWQQARYQSTARQNRIVVSDLCSVSEGPYLALHAGLSGEVSLGNGVSFVSDVTFDNLRLPDVGIVNCPAEGVGNLFLVGAHIGVAYRFGL
jgi:hypothetical protein